MNELTLLVVVIICLYLVWIDRRISYIIKLLRDKKITLRKDVLIYEIDNNKDISPQKKKGTKMTEIQQDQYGVISYTFVDDSGNPTDVKSIEVVSSNPEFLTAVAEPKAEVGVYPFRLDWVAEGVGTLELSAEARVGGTPIVDQEAFSTIPNIAEGVSKNVVINEL
jgi:hypothetical protein